MPINIAPSPGFIAKFRDLPGPLAPLLAGWKYHDLILRLVRREIEARYRGSVLGLTWALIVPLVFLLVYTFVFSVVFAARWDAPVAGRGHFALLLFSGLIQFNIFSECLIRAPGLMLNNPSYIKKVVFPIEILPWVMLMAALFNAVISLVVLLVGYVVLLGTPPLTALMVPFLSLPLIIATLGLSFLLASLGVFLRDLGQMMGVVITVLMFLSPVFYPLSAVPERFRVYVAMNPVTIAVEQTRQVLFWGQIPAHWTFLGYLAGSLLMLWFGHTWFMKTKKGFADVV